MRYCERKEWIGYEFKKQETFQYELKNALVLQKALNHCKNNFRKMDLQALQAECFRILQKESNPEYFEICDAESLSPITEISETKNIRAFTATSIGEIRLIDNMEIL